MDGSGRRVLIVDDDETLRALLQVSVAEDGYEVETAPDAATAFRALERRVHEFDAVVLDLGLPDFPGAIVLRRARRLRPDLPIIAASGSPEAATSGADVVIAKPYGPRDVRRALAALTSPATPKV